MDISGKRFNSAFPNQSWEPVKPILMDPEAMTQDLEAGRRMGMAGVQLGGEVIQAIQHIEDITERTQVVDASANLAKQARNYTMQLRQNSIGKNAQGITPLAEKDMSQMVVDLQSTLPSNRAKTMFQKQALGITDSYLNVVASHELSHLEKYRTDTMQSAFTNAHEDIRLSNGDPKLVGGIIGEYEKTLDILYEGQPTADLKQSHKALLLKAGREAQNKFSETVVYDIVKSQATTVNPQGNPEIDVSKATKILMFNPDNIPEISAMTIEKRTQIADIIAQTANRNRTLMIQAQEKTEGTMWDSYLDLLLGNTPKDGAPSSFNEWYNLASEYTRGGKIRDHILTTVINYRKQEMSLERSISAQRAAESRRMVHEAQMEEDRARRQNPFLMSDPNIVGPLMARVLSDPSKVNNLEIHQVIGRGVSWEDGKRMLDIKEGDAKKLWGSPSGRYASVTLAKHRDNYMFSGNSDTMLNNERYSKTITEMDSWLRANPNATPEDAEKQIKKLMYPYTTGFFRKQIDKITGNPRID